MPEIQQHITELRWKLKEKGNETTVNNLANELNINPILANLLVQRNITTFEEAKRFFRPKYEHLHDPFLMKDMTEAVHRLTKAVHNKEKILIYGDYDVDGTTSVALVYMFLKQFYADVFFYIPDRYTEGYGISKAGIDYAHEHGISLIMTVDCGIKANGKINYAREKGIECIISDHHTPGDEIPCAYAVVDPKQEDCGYPYKELSGCGVAFKILQGFSLQNNMEFDKLAHFLDLVAVSIASDIVPLTGENRILAYYGLKKINHSPGRGLSSIIKIAGISDKKILLDDIVFKIGPRINAAGRMDSGNKAVELLICKDAEQVDQISKEINLFNNSRKHIDRKITQEALDIITGDEKYIQRKTTVLFNPDWHEGVLGIVASRLKDYYYRPTVVLTESNGYITGSARSVDGFNLYKAIEGCGDLLENFGGHLFAAGLTMKKEKISYFNDRFEKLVSESIKDEQLYPQIEVDAELSLSDITPGFYRILRQFQPFGPENTAPAFVTRNVSDSGYGRIVGSTKEHLKLDLVHEEDPMHSISAIAFQKAKHYEAISQGNPFDICYSIEENEFMGRTNLQIRIKDIKVNDIVYNTPSDSLP